MEVLRIHLDSREARNAFDILMPYLSGEVFHVTRECNYSKIISSGFILPNAGTQQTSFGFSTNSYFRNKGCISVFDYRCIDDPEPKSHMYKCLPTAPLTPASGIAIFILESEVDNLLLSWEGWKSEDLSQMVVPYVEAGYPGPLPLKMVKQVLIVTKDKTSDSYVDMLEQMIINERKSRAQTPGRDLRASAAASRLAEIIGQA
uniref:Uncharacterized protein n=1 Tax=Geobacter sp. (strain M21) TaxID=443144 RepID=C6E2C2_GEOSM